MHNEKHHVISRNEMSKDKVELTRYLLKLHRVIANSSN